MSLDWDKEDGDVVAVVAFSDAPDTLLKNQEGNTVLRKGRGEEEWEDLGDSLEWYKERFSSRLHIRPEPEKPEWTIYNNDKPFGELSAKQPEPSMVDKFIADVPAGLDWREVELAALHMINEGWVKS